MSDHPTPSPAPASGAETRCLNLSIVDGRRCTRTLDEHARGAHHLYDMREAPFIPPTSRAGRSETTPHRLAGNSNYEMAGVRARAAASTPGSPQEAGSDSRLAHARQALERIQAFAQERAQRGGEFQYLANEAAAGLSLSTKGDGNV